MILISSAAMGAWGQAPHLLDRPRVCIDARKSARSCSVDVRGTGHPVAIAIDGSSQPQG